VLGIESCTVMSLVRHLLFPCSDTCCKYRMYRLATITVWPQCTASQLDRQTDNMMPIADQSDRLKTSEL